MKRNLAAALGALILASANHILEAAEPDQQAGTLSEAITRGKASLSFRYRYEYVDQAGIADKAKASTLRTQIGLETAEFHNFKLRLELNNVLVIGSERYNSTRNGLTQFPVVADPDGTDLNEGYLEFTPGKSRFVVGREKVNLDNQRFIGSVDWRQNAQSLDLVWLETQELAGWNFDYGYVWQVNRIFGPDDGSPPATFDSKSHLVNIRYDDLQHATVTGYAYLLDLENSPADSSQSFGVRVHGDWEFAEKRSFRYAVEYATQSDYGDNPNSYSTDYHLVELGFGIEPFAITAGWEVLGGNDRETGQSFRTPLATLHKFQGWTDQFLTTPDAGVDDRYINLSASFFGATASLIYHDFKAESGGQNYGSEWDFSISGTIAKRHALLFKYADYNADGFATDTTKWWMQYLIKF